MNEELTNEDILSLITQLRDRNRIKYNSELDVVYFSLISRNNEELIKSIYPDIIIHKRGTRNNFIVIEVKKTVNKDKRSRAFDIIKLITLINAFEFSYSWGYFIDLPTGKDFKRHDGFLFSTENLEEKVTKVQSIKRIR